MIEIYILMGISSLDKQEYPLGYYLNKDKCQSQIEKTINKDWPLAYCQIGWETERKAE